MSLFGSLAELSPKMIKYPIEKIIKAVVNIALQRKIFSSILRIFGAAIGVAIGVLIPQLSEIALFLAYVTLDINLSYASAITLSTTLTAWIGSSAFIYLVKKSCQSYYTHKYGVSNPEHRLTDNDKKHIYRKNIEKSNDEINKLVSLIEIRINEVVIELQKFKIIENQQAIRHMKLILTKLKQGDLTFYDEHFQVIVSNSRRKSYDYANIMNYKNHRSAPSIFTEGEKEPRMFTRRVSKKPIFDSGSDSDCDTDSEESRSTILRSFRKLPKKKDCQDTPYFDILPENKSKL